MTTVVTLAAEKRERTGKGAARALRRENKIPAIIYGHGQDQVMIALDAKEMAQRFKKISYMSQLYDIEVGGKKFRVIPGGAELHPVTDRIEHLDFIHVTKGSLVHVKVKVNYVGQDKSMGIKRGGVLNIVSRELDLICHPDVIPHHLDVDVSGMNIGDSIHIKDIALPEGVKIQSKDQNLTLVTVAGRTADEPSEGAAGEGGTAGSA